MLTLESFRKVVPDETLTDIYQKARKLYGKKIINLNATYQGGGVAEILYSLVLMMNDIGIDTGWRILHGSQEFFEITKGFHNALQGGELELTQEMKDVYLTINETFAKFSHLYHDIVVIHDPQPLALINYYRKKQPWIWRCHIDLTEPHGELWDFMQGNLLKYDQMVVSEEKYIRKALPVDQRVMPPAINPLSAKNSDMTPEEVLCFIKEAGIPTDKPIISQVSRLDPWKDPEGVIDVWEKVREQIDCRLILCYNVASDDPEGYRIYEKVIKKAGKHLETKDILLVVGNNERLVNAVQRYSDVIIQKSTREGFCLAATEALWKGTPVVASNIGGLPTQINDGESGFLVDPYDFDGFADRIVALLKDDKLRRKIGPAGRENVRNKFLITRLLSDYLDMFIGILNQ
ncbi:MAG: glycosyltransferase [Chlamydiota bacterium]